MSGQKVCKCESMKTRMPEGMKRKSYEHLASLGVCEFFKISVRKADSSSLRSCRSRTDPLLKWCVKSMHECENQRGASLGRAFVRSMLNSRATAQTNWGI